MDDVDADSSGSEQSLDEEFGIPSVKNLRVRRMHTGNRTLGSNRRPRRCQRMRNPV